MHFLPDVYVPCEVCNGARYNRDTLEVTFRGKTIADVLDLSCEEALAFFAHQPPIARHLQTLVDVGLGYIRLGQPAPTLSGGEAQRVKLSSRAEPAVHRAHPLHARRADHRSALRRRPQAAGRAHRLVDQGNTVVVIEHNLDVVKTADWIIDLGPEGGDRGGGWWRRARPSRWPASQLHRAGAARCWASRYGDPEGAAQASPGCQGGDHDQRLAAKPGRPPRPRSSRRGHARASSRATEGASGR